MFCPLVVVAMSGVDDVRPVLDHYRQFDDPLAAFKAKQEQLMVSKHCLSFDISNSYHLMSANNEKEIRFPC